MLFNSLPFILFFPVVIIIYFLVPPRLRHLWLLIASYYFYMSWNIQYGLLILITTVITFASGILMQRFTRYKKGILAISLMSNLAILFFFKYYNFIVENINHISFNGGGINTLNVILPVGISFYTFQALSYSLDVYRGTIKAESYFSRYALFVSFFPQLVAGPIERSASLLKQIDHVEEIKVLNYRRITNGLIMMLYGLFLKMVIADRISILVDTVFESYQTYRTFELIVAAAAFALQIYCDFSSYSTIAIGAAEVMGFHLMENFDTPYFSMSIKEFWRRWHISLSQWFRDYVYIPMGGNRCGKIRKYTNLLITFLISGLWHGANWTFIVWGGIHGAYQIIGEVLEPLRTKICGRMSKNCLSYKLGRIIGTFILVDIAWIFFRSDSVNDAINYIYRLCTRINPWACFDGTLYSLGLDRVEMNILIVGIIIMLLVELVKYKAGHRLDEFLCRQNLWFKWLVIFSMIYMVIIFGEYGATFDAKQFIYFQF